MTIPDYAEPMGPYWLLKNDQSISRAAKVHGDIAYDRDFIDLPELKAMPEGSLAIDVGAFIGDITKVFLNHAGFSTVLAFEPQPDAFTCLDHNCPEAKCWRVALGDGRKVSLFESSGGNMGGRHVVPDGPLVTSTLDHYLPPVIPPTFLKLDAEGFEPAILEGAKRLLADPNLKHVVCEFNPAALARFGWKCEDILKYLPRWGYREIFRYGEENWDCIFSRPTV